MYQFNIEYIEGGLNCTPDWSSRNPVREAADTEANSEAESAIVAFAVYQGDGITSVTWGKGREAAIFDEECAALSKLIVDCFPETKAQLPLTLRYYWSMYDHLYVIKGVLFKGRKMLFPKSLRGQTKALLECNQKLLNASSGQALVPPYSSRAQNAENAKKISSPIRVVDDICTARIPLLADCNRF